MDCKTTLFTILLTTLTMTGCKTTQTPVTSAPDGISVGETSTPPEKEAKTMPQGRLLQVSYEERGMNFPEFGDFKLSRRSEPPTLTFRHWSDEVKIAVSDSLFDAALNIIKEERMYEYESKYDDTPPGVRLLDGMNWDFMAVFEGKQYIFASGKSTWPKNRKGLDLIIKLLTEAAMKGYEQKQ